jgi:glycosyltransferase involved in cell wall biosynthesis
MTRHVALPWRAGKAKIYRSLWPNIIPVSEAVKRALKKSGVPETSMIVAKAGLPEAKFRRSREAVREDVGISKSSFFAGSFSRLTKEKGVDIFLRAMPRAPGVQALIYGEGPKGEELAKLSSFMRVANQVHFMGRVDDVADHMRAMDVVVIPSIWEEAFPYAALEAFLVGTPVIGADVGGMPEIVTEGETGLLFQKGNSEDLLRALLEAKAQPDRLANMARKARETYESNYTLSLMADRIESAYISFGARL